MCIFCSIIEGKIPCYKIYEDDKVLAFLDIAQETCGHTVVVTKNHYKDMTEIPDEELTHMITVVKKISQHYIGDLAYDGVNIVNNCKPSAGQSVDHIHFHILPRTTGDNKKLAISPVSTSKVDLQAIQQKLKML